jgi:hypothetical protein
MSNTNTGGPAFPLPNHQPSWTGGEGTTLRQYAAIKLKVPDSGTDWLDDMIRQSLRDDFAAKAMQAYITAWAINREHPLFDETTSQSAYMVADAMLKSRES